ncbi:MAG: CocE/NonD family hydrolase, partial [Elusimicrobiota bacterium]
MDSLMFKIGWRLLFYPALICAILSFIVFWLYVHPKRFINPSHPKNFRLTAEELKLETADGIKLDAWFIPHKTSKKAVIICHGYPMDKGDVLGVTVFLAREFNLLYFDFRTTGKSGGFFFTGGAREVRDIDAAVKFLEVRGYTGGIGIFGFSVGGATALLSRNPSLKARALDAPFAELAGELDYVFRPWGIWRKPLLALMKAWSRILLGVDMNSINPVKNAAAFTAPVLLVHGDADTQVPVGNSLAINVANPSSEL